MPDVQANGITIHYEERGSGDPLILIMGLGADGSLWEDHVKEYEKHFRCILMDNRGAGLSDKPEGPYSTKMMADDTAGLMDALGIEKAHIAGISMGGAIGQELALNHPDKVRSLVLVSTWAKCNNYAVTVFEHFRKIREVAKPDHFLELLQLWIFAPPYYDGNMDALREGQQDAAANENPMPQHAFSGQSDACINHDTTGRLDQIKVPTLITIGDQDIFTPPEFSQYLHENIAGSEFFFLEGTGHAHHWEALEKYNSKTSSFMQAH